jgi:hypothetical protein
MSIPDDGALPGTSRCPGAEIPLVYILGGPLPILEYRNSAQRLHHEDNDILLPDLQVGLLAKYDEVRIGSSP